jgi:NTE family protein
VRAPAALALSMLLPVVAAAQEPPPRLALVLSGGGARGIAHVGALRALEEAGLPIDAIAGTSMGAAVGALYAGGPDAAQLERVVRRLDWGQLFVGRSDRRVLPVTRRDDRPADWVTLRFEGAAPRWPAGLLAEHRINRFLIEHLAAAGHAAGGDFGRLRVPFRAVATDLESGERVVLARGDLARAVRASMSVPVVFPPVSWEGRTLVDGGLVDNVPVSVARELGAAVVVAVDITSPPPESLDTSFAIGAQVTDLLTRRRNEDFAAPADLTVRPDLGRLRSGDFDRFDALIRAGYEATRAAVPEIRALLLAKGVTDLAPRPAPAPGPALEGAPIAEVEARGPQLASAALLRRLFNVPVGPGYVMERGLRAFDKVAASGLLEHAWLEFEEVPGGLRLVLSGRDAAPNQLGLGLGYSEWDKARASLRLRHQNALGFGEQVELLLSGSDALLLARASLRGDRLFVAGLGYRVGVSLAADKPRFFDADGERLGRARFERATAGAALEVPLERWGALSAGARFGRVSTFSEPGVPLPEARDTVGELFAELTLDNLDDVLWPQAGGRLVVRAEAALDALGAERPHRRLDVEARLARAFGRTALDVAGRYATSRDGVPLYDQFRLGGLELPGHRQEELKGPHALALSAGLRRPLGGSGLQALARVGLGDTFADRVRASGLRWGASVGLGYASRVGPIRLELGVREGGATLLALGVGLD